jgi:hypothetical protein
MNISNKELFNNPPKKVMVYCYIFRCTYFRCGRGSKSDYKPFERTKEYEVQEVRDDGIIILINEYGRRHWVDKRYTYSFKY